MIANRYIGSAYEVIGFESNSSSGSEERHSGQALFILGAVLFYALATMLSVRLSIVIVILLTLCSLVRALLVHQRRLPLRCLRT